VQQTVRQVVQRLALTPVIDVMMDTGSQTRVQLNAANVILTVRQFVLPVERTNVTGTVDQATTYSLSLNSALPQLPPPRRVQPTAQQVVCRQGLAHATVVTMASDSTSTNRAVVQRVIQTVLMAVRARSR